MQLKNFDPSALAEMPEPTRAIAHRNIGDYQNKRMLQDRFPEIRAAKFDLQYTTDENRQLWALSDLTSVDASANFMVRRTLRMRCRQAYHNNPYAMGAANRLANHVIGPGPALHMATDNKLVNDAVEKSFAKWAKRVHLARKLRTSRAARFYNGEGFNLLRTNPKLKHSVKLDLFEIEADQVSSPLFGIYPSQYVDQYFDGVMLDPWGNPETYHILRQHPGAFGAFAILGYEFDPWPARYVIHDYGRLRPAQQRGIPEMAPVAQKFEELRRYSGAVLAAAETAADYAGFLQTPGPTEQDGANTASSMSPMDTVDIQRRMMTVLADGQTAFQMKAEQPTNTMPDFVLTQLVEISQVIDMPLFILTGDARLANMASAYVASDGFVKRIKTDRDEYDILLSEQIFPEFLAEARLIPGEIPNECPDDPDHSWRWPRPNSHADPQKMAEAQRLKLQNGQSPSTVFSDEGLSWDEMVERGASDYGIKPEEYKAALFQSIFASKGMPPAASLVPGTGDEPTTPDDEE